MIQVEKLRPPESSELFVSYVKPHKPVASKSLARWMTAILSLGGVDPAIYQQHSSRSAAAAHHQQAGLTYKQLCNLADWSQCSRTYRNFYERYL